MGLNQRHTYMQEKLWNGWSLSSHIPRLNLEGSLLKGKKKKSHADSSNAGYSIWKMLPKEKDFNTYSFYNLEMCFFSTQWRLQRGYNCIFSSISCCFCNDHVYAIFVKFISYYIVVSKLYYVVFEMQIVSIWYSTFHSDFSLNISNGHV